MHIVIDAFLVFTTHDHPLINLMDDRVGRLGGRYRVCPDIPAVSVNWAALKVEHTT